MQISEYLCHIYNNIRNIWDKFLKFEISNLSLINLYYFIDVCYTITGNSY